jgi:hypothetical protein
VVTADRFEPNDDFPHATDTGVGLSGHATLTAGDQDLYRVVSNGTLNSPYLTAKTVFMVTRTDVPVTVTLYDQNGAQVGAPSVGGMDCQGGAGFPELPAGVWYAAVRPRTAGAQGSYEFHGGVSGKSSTGPVHDRVWARLHPGDPVEGILHSFDRYLFTMSPEVERLGVIAQSPVRLQLLDLQGNLVAEGQLSQLPRVGDVTLVDLSSLAMGTDYLVELSRPDAQTELDPGSLSGIAYTLGWANATPTDSGNIVANGDADDPNQQIGFGEVVRLRSWTAPADSNLTVVGYGTQGFPGFNDLLPPLPGHAFFAGGPDNTSSSAEQLIDLTGQWSGWLGLIDAGQVTFTLSAFLGGFGGENDAAVLQATFLDAAGQPLAAAVSLGPVTLAERGGLTGFLPRQQDGLVPSGTRQVLLGLVMTRTDGVYNDGYADAIELHLQHWGQPGL